ncbi:hypothetical protein [Photobacterium damselae]|uniref:hypothetical protein n=1 Tax=Photobacterium damselae TaxID=38293 RepID=UPI001302C584|nr:hypothetical protein [Photobacterium damselae]
MTASQNHKYNQLKWLYSALSGFCAAYFLAFFSGSQSIEQSPYLLISTLLFSVCLPIFTAFAIAHVYMSESDLAVEQCDRALNLRWVKWLTIWAFSLLYFAVWFLAAFFSFWVVVAFTIASASCFFIFVFFIRRLHSLSMAKS